MSSKVIYDMFATMIGKLTVNQLSDMVNNRTSLANLVSGGDRSKLLYAKNLLDIMGLDKKDFTTILLLSHIRKTRPDLYGFVMKENNNKIWFDNQVKDIKGLLWG